MMSDHYRSHPSGIEAIEITQFESFLRGNIIKYVMRAPYKGDELADLEKAAEYLQWEIERVKEEKFLARFEELDKMRDEWDSDENIGYVADNWEDPDYNPRLAKLMSKQPVWLDDYYDYYRAGVSKTIDGIFEAGKNNYKIKPFDEVVYPDNCQECQGDCKVCGD